MANLKDLQNRLQTIAEAEKNGGILDIPTEAMQILAMCNSIRANLLHEVNEELGDEEEINILIKEAVDNERKNIRQWLFDEGYELLSEKI